jgi:hypothetical protein
MITVPVRSSYPDKLTEQLMGIKRRVLYFMPIYMPLSVSFEPMFEKRRYCIASTFNARYQARSANTLKHAIKSRHNTVNTEVTNIISFY